MVPAGPLTIRSSGLVWELGQSGQPCSRRTVSIYDSDSDLWKLRQEGEAEWSQSTTWRRLRDERGDLSDKRTTTSTTRRLTLPYQTTMTLSP